ncbi:MAG TPA: hypothetical protein VGQ30_13810 [Gemmatimonadaceae bacterium]|nr:hypothetical protein [Gemmatimonadaceae bacterium]
MKFFKTRPVKENLSARFRPVADVFAMRREGDVYVAEVRASPERAVELFHELSEMMPEVVDLALDCVRTGRNYVGEGLHLSEVTDTIARMKVALAASGGVELSVYTAEEQLCLSPMLELWIYAKSDRWLYLLLGRGLEERATLPAREWRIRAAEFSGAPELVDAVTAAAERLTLKLGS